MAEETISVSSPLGSGLMGGVVGQSVSIASPAVHSILRLSELSHNETPRSSERGVVCRDLFQRDTVLIEREPFTADLIDVVERDEGVWVDLFDDRLQPIDFVSSNDDV